MIERREIDPNINIIILVSVITTLFHNHHYFLTILILYTICAILALLMVGTRPLLDHAPSHLAWAGHQHKLEPNVNLHVRLQK